MSWWARPVGRIFINYRRDDAVGVAGRLSDSLSRYFGDGRVFRDVDGIRAGANFEEVLKNTTQGADAMIVLIGRQWTTLADAQGRPRLHDPDDWVAREVAAALEKKIPIYPVLIENAQMPRADELPPPLQPLVRHNAISISDHRWNSDVTRLAKVVAIDIPGSAAERTLQWLRVVISVALFASVTLTLGVACWLWFHGQIEADAVTGKVLKAGPVQEVTAALLGITFIVIVGCSMLLLFFARLFDPPRRPYAYAAALVGLLGTLTFFVLYWVFDGVVHESAGMVFGSTVTALAVLILMNQTGFKAR
jgi:hypothetical protein